MDGITNVYIIFYMALFRQLTGVWRTQILSLCFKRVKNARNLHLLIIMSESVYTMFPEIFSYNGRKVISLSFHRHKIFKNDPASERISDCEQSHFCHQSEMSAVFRLCHVHWARGRFNSRIFVVDELQCCVPRLVMCLLQ